MFHGSLGARPFKSSSRSPAPPWATRLVLLIDDDNDFRAALAANLADDGYEVSAFARPGDIPELGAAEPPRALILDYQMGGEDGLSFADRFHAAYPAVPVLMVTAYWSRYLDAEVASRPYILLRRKPIEYDDLVRLLSEGAFEN